MSEDLTKKLSQSADEKLTLILTTVQGLTVRVDKLELGFAGLNQKVDERLYDTRPIWQKVVLDITQLQGTVDQIQKGQETLITDVDEIKMSIRDIYGRFEVLTESIITTQIRNRDMDRRVRALESNTNPPNTQT
jgi:peptidoglycan hydrolase CwlO-like protein